jgi:hypothetical protein
MTNLCLTPLCSQACLQAKIRREWDILAVRIIQITRKGGKKPI